MSMKVTVKPLSELHRPERNVRMHTDKQIAEFRRSVEMFGQIRPIVCDEHGTILAGNGLYETLLSLGWEKADCYVVSGLTESQKKKLMMADNRIFDLGVDDMKVFDEFVLELGGIGDFDVPGFDNDLLQSMVASMDEVDDMMSSYGIVDDQKKEQIQTAAETYRKEEENRPEPVPDHEPEQKLGRHVVCPKCGETIWL